MSTGSRSNSNPRKGQSSSSSSIPSDASRTFRRSETVTTTASHKHPKKFAKLRHEKEEEAAAIDSEKRNSEEREEEVADNLSPTRQISAFESSAASVTISAVDTGGDQITAAVEQLGHMLNSNADSRDSKDDDVEAIPRLERRASIGGKWSTEEDDKLRHIVETHGAKNWKEVASMLGTTRSDVQCLHRWKKVLKPGLQKGSWSKEEDEIVRDMVAKHGIGKGKWAAIAEKLPGRIGKQCRERWLNHLDPDINKGDWSRDELVIIYEAHRLFGSRWCEISKLLPGRTENAVKNRWNSSRMKKWRKEWQEQQGYEQDCNLEGSSEFGDNCSTEIIVDGTEKRQQKISDTFKSRLTAAGVTLQPSAVTALQALLRTVTGSAADSGADRSLLSTKRDRDMHQLDGDYDDTVARNSGAGLTKRIKRSVNGGDDADPVLGSVAIERVAELVVQHICSAGTQDANEGDVAGNTLLQKLAEVVKQKLDSV